MQSGGPDAYIREELHLPVAGSGGFGVLAEEESDRWVQIRHFPDRRKAEQHALVLIAMQISCRLDRREWGIGLSVSSGDEARARRELAQYAAENRRPAAPPSPSPHPATAGIDGALAYTTVMIAVSAAAERMLFGADWIPAGAANAGLINGGEWWRGITALGLHADFGHLAANLAGGVLIGIVLAQLVGGGLAWLSILIAGALGNLAAAAFADAGHSAIGASTAIFGGLGVVSVLAWRRHSFTRRGLRGIAPLVAGATLLAFLGGGGGEERIDVAGHLAGFLCGGATAGLLLLLGRRVPEGRAAQFAYAGVTLAVFAGAWAIALRQTGIG